MDRFRERTEMMAHAQHPQKARDVPRAVAAHGVSVLQNVPFVDAARQVPGGDAVVQRAAAATTTSTSGLASDSTRAFVDLLGRQTVLGRLLAAGALPAAPMTALPPLTLAPEPQWLGEGRPIPIALLAATDRRMPSGKYGVMQGYSRELFRQVDDRTVSAIERITVRALRRADDRLLLSSDPASDGAPAGLLNGVTPIVGGSPQSLDAGLQTLWTSVRDGDPDVPRFILSPRGAMYLASLREADGSPAFPDVSPATGGNIYGVEVLLSKAAAHHLILVDASLIAIHDGTIEIERSESAAVQMVDDPTNSSATATPTAMVSAFQTNSVLLRFVRWASWLKLADDAVGFLELPIAGSPS